MTIKRNDIKALVITGDGINCEAETAAAFKEQGINAEIIHISDLITHPHRLKSAHILALPGGFSFGDEIGSGQILALKIKYSFENELKTFIEDKKLVIGICNGFQALVRLGLLPKPFEPRTMTLTHNEKGHFINQWVDLNVTPSICAWTSELEGMVITLPIRHGEGKIVFKGDEVSQKNAYQSLYENGQIALSYTENVNGSYQNIAGVCDPTGRIFGLMPHPEAATSQWLYPSGKDKKNQKGVGEKIFSSAVKYCEMNF